MLPLFQLSSCSRVKQDTNIEGWPMPWVSKVIVVIIIRYAIRIISCVKSFILYWCIISVHESYDTMCVSYKSYRIVKSYVSYDT